MEETKAIPSLFDAARWLYFGELVVTTALLALIVALGVLVSPWASLGAFAASILGIVFTTLSHARRDVHLIITERAE